MSNITTEQMKIALANAGVTNAPSKPKGTLNSADVVAAVGSGAVAAAEEAVAGTVNFFDRVKTRYAYNRALRAGLIPTPDVAPKVTRTRTAKV